MVNAQELLTGTSGLKLFGPWRIARGVVTSSFPATSDTALTKTVYTVKSKADWDKWRGAEILHVEDWKPGVKRLHIRDSNHFYLVFCKDELLPDKHIERYA